MTGYRSALFAALLGISPFLAAQDKLERDLDFVRALAERMRFIELAKTEVERLATEHRGAGEQDRIAQLGVQISFYGAKSNGDRAVQRTLFSEALERSKELIERSSDEQVLLQARKTLADASQEFGQFLIEELEVARENDPDAVKELEEKASEVFRAGIDACKKVRDALEPERSRDERKNIEYCLFWMRTGVLMREQGLAVKADREVLVERAIEVLTEMVLDVGEETAIGLRGLFEIAHCSEVINDMMTAMDMYQATIEQISTSLEEGPDLGLGGDTLALLFEMLQEVYVRTAEVMLREGDPNIAELFADFRAKMAKFGEQGVELFDVVDPRWGHLMLLAESRFKAESGDPGLVGEALAMVQRINEKHPRDYVGIKAKAALKDILSVQKNLVSGKLLFEIAKGDLQNKDYEAAIQGMRRAIAVMTDQEKNEVGLDAWYGLGYSYYQTKRYLESILALTQGLQDLGESNEEIAVECADVLESAVGLHKRQTNKDGAFNPIWDTAAEEVGKNGAGGPSKLAYKAGNEAFRGKDYARAISEYNKITPDFQLFETTRVRIAKSFVMAGDIANANAALQAYADYCQKNPIASNRPDLQQARDGATSEAEFLDAQITYWLARGNPQLNLDKTPTKYPEAIQKMRAYVTNHGAHSHDAPNVPIAIECLGRLHSDIGELDRAEECYAQLKQKDPVRGARLATEIFVEYQNQLKSLTQELTDALANDNKSAQETAESELQRARQKICALGLDYIANSASPQLAVMVNTMIAFEELGNWERVDEVARKTLDSYGASQDATTKRIIDQRVRPMIGEALLRQRKFTQAYEMLLEAEKAFPEQWDIKRQIARCLGGWFEFDKSTGRAVKEPGLDRPAEAYLKYYQDYRPWALRPEVEQFSLDWYRFHWECYWFALQAAAKDSEYKDRAGIFYRKAASTDDFKTLKSLGPEGDKLYQYFQFNR